MVISKFADKIHDDLYHEIRELAPKIKKSVKIEDIAPIPSKNKVLRVYEGVEIIEKEYMY